MKRKFCVALLLVSIFAINTIAFADGKPYSNVGIPQAGYGGVTVISDVSRSVNLNYAYNTCSSNTYNQRCYCAVRNTYTITGDNGNPIAAGTLIVTGGYFTRGSVKMPYLANAKIDAPYSTYLRVENTELQGTNITGEYDADVN